MSTIKRALSMFGAVVAMSGAAALAVQVYRRPEDVLLGTMRLGMIASGAREGTIDTAGLPMHYYSMGQRGTPIVLVHGLGGSAENWAMLQPRLSSEYLVYAPDLPGFGKTPLAPEGTNIHTHVLYLKRFIDALGYPRVTLAGNSLGGWISTRFAVEYPQYVKRLYLLNSAGLRREGALSPYAPDRTTAAQTIQRMWNVPLPIPGFVLDAMIRNSQRPAYAGFIRNYDHTEELDTILERIQVPTTIIWGMKDHLLPAVCAQDFHKGIAGSRLILLPDAGHTPQVGAASEVARIILDDATAMNR